MSNIVDQIDTILPQTQCTKCGYPDCKAYAKAIADGTPHNQCPPGGKKVIAALSRLLERPVMPLNPENGKHQPKLVAYIREDECIGCVKCIKACPVDAIIGSGKMMHTVIASECTGCDLCVPACPVDCIDMMPAQDNTLYRNTWRQRHVNREQRLQQLTAAREQQHQKNISDKQDYLAAALARAKAKKGAQNQ